MCIGDWRLGRLVRSVGRTVIPSDGDTDRFGPSRQRVGLTFEVHLPTPVVNSACLITFTNGQRLLVGAGTNSLHVTIATHGDLPTYGFTVDLLTTGVTCTVIEYFAPEEYLQAGLDEFRRMIAMRS